MFLTPPGRGRGGGWRVGAAIASYCAAAAAVIAGCFKTQTRIKPRAIPSIFNGKDALFDPPRRISQQRTAARARIAFSHVLLSPHSRHKRRPSQRPRLTAAQVDKRKWSQLFARPSIEGVIRIGAPPLPSAPPRAHDEPRVSGPSIHQQYSPPLPPPPSSPPLQLQAVS